MRPAKPRSAFSRFAKWTAHATGRPVTFFLATAVLVVWALTGPIFNFSDTWQLIINTGTTIVTFLMVFLIQNTQNRDSVAMQIKLDELIHVSEAASNALMDLEELDEATLERYRAHYETLAREARQLARKLGGDEIHPPPKHERTSRGGEE